MEHPDTNSAVSQDDIKLFDTVSILAYRDREDPLSSSLMTFVALIERQSSNSNWTMKKDIDIR